MTEENRNTSNGCSGKTLIIAAAVVVLVIIFMYFRDQGLQRDYELRRLEKRVELFEEWENRQEGLTPPPAASEAMVAGIMPWV